jgi:hypothetical protein
LTKKIVDRLSIYSSSPSSSTSCSPGGISYSEPSYYLLNTSREKERKEREKAAGLS